MNNLTSNFYVTNTIYNVSVESIIGRSNDKNPVAHVDEVSPFILNIS